MTKTDEAIHNVFVDAILAELCNIVNETWVKGKRIAGPKREQKIAYIRSNSGASINDLIGCIIKHDVIMDATWVLDDKGIWFGMQDMEDGYNYAIIEVEKMLAAAK